MIRIVASIITLLGCVGCAGFNQSAEADYRAMAIQACAQAGYGLNHPRFDECVVNTAALAYQRDQEAYARSRAAATALLLSGALYDDQPSRSAASLPAPVYGSIQPVDADTAPRRSYEPLTSSRPGMMMCPDGTYAYGTSCSMAPDGTYVSGRPTMAPDGTYVGGAARMAPDGSYVGGGGSTLCPDGTYVGGRSCALAPDGSYVGVP